MDELWKKLWSPTMDTNANNKFRLAVRMVEDGALEASEMMRQTQENWFFTQLLVMM